MCYMHVNAWIFDTPTKRVRASPLAEVQRYKRIKLGDALKIHEGIIIIFEFYSGLLQMLSISITWNQKKILLLL